MHIQTLKSPNSCNKSSLQSPFVREILDFSPHHRKKPNPKPHFPPFSPSCKNCKTIAIAVSKNRPNSYKVSDPRLDDGRGVSKVADVATLGNLCVDVVLNVPSLPPASFEERKAYMERLAASRPDKPFFPLFLQQDLGLISYFVSMHLLDVSPRHIIGWYVSTMNS